MSVFNLLYRNSFELSSKFDIFSSYFSFIYFLNVFLNVSLTSKNQNYNETNQDAFLYLLCIISFCAKNI